MGKDKIDICIDFDGTVVAHEFPNVGHDVGAVPVLKKLIEKGHRLILFTMRSNKTGNTGTSKEVPEIHNGNFLDDAIKWFDTNGISLYGIQSNPTQKNWTNSPKAYGQLYIDDAALGTPLLQKFKAIHTDETVHTCSVDHIKYKQVKDLVGKPYVDWKKVEDLLIEKGIL